MKKIIYKFFINRFFFLVLLAALLICLSVDVKSAWLNTNLAVLNRLRPDYYENLIKVGRDVTATSSDVDEYRRYYQKVAEIMPKLADAKGLYAYSLYYSGDDQEAIAVYEDALKINPTFFWFYYNLGLIYYQDGNYVKAQSHLEQALNQKPQAALVFILHSPRIYLPVVLAQSSSENLQEFLKKQLTEGYQNAYKLLTDSVYRQKNPALEGLDPQLSKLPLAVY